MVVEHILVVPGPPNLTEKVEVVSLVLHEQIADTICEQIVRVPVAQVAEQGVARFSGRAWYCFAGAAWCRYNAWRGASVKFLRRCFTSSDMRVVNVT